MATPLQQLANQQAAAATNAAIAPLQQQITANDQTNANNGLAIQGFATALSQLLGAIPGQVNQTYTDAANSQAAFAKGFSDAIQGKVADANQANNSFLTQMGAPASALKPAANIGDVTYGLGGFIPASTMNREGAAFTAAAKMLPGDALLRGQQDFQNNLNQGYAADAKVRQQIADILGKQPGLALDQLSKLTAQAQASQRINLAGQKVNPTLSASMGFLVNDQGQILPGKGGKPIPYVPYQKPGVGTIVKGADGYYRIAPDGTITNLGISPPKATGSPSSQFIHSGANVYRINPDGTLTQVIAAPPPKSQDGKQGGFTPKQISDFKKVAAATAADLWEGVANFDKKSGKFTGWVQQPLTYQQALQYMTDRGIPMWIAQLSLKRYWTKPGMDMAPDARAALTQAGKPIVPAWAKSDTGPIYARGQGTKVYKAGKVLAAQGAATNDPLAQKVIGLAVQALGTPYVWGGSRPGGFDCSGLLYYVWGQAGVQIPRTTYDQWSAGQAVPLNQLQPGDAVFFKGSDSRTTSTGQLLPGHVAMYVGDGKIIEAYGRGVPVRVTTLAGRNDLMGARRFG